MQSPKSLQPFDELSVWSRGDQRAPHKPLLILYALARWASGDRQPILFADAEPDLMTLLKEFGPPRQSYHPEYPFWRLQNDGVWTVTANAPLKPRKSSDNPPKSELLVHEARGSFSAEVRDALESDPGVLARIATKLLEDHFPASIHQDILNAIGLTLAATKQKRDPSFRQKVLKAYEWRCAVCGFDVRLGTVAIALDAAHIRWHQAGGPDVENNGLALCVLHHKTFDLGAFTVTGGVLVVSDQANGTAGFQETLMAYHGKPIRPPQHPGWKPEAGHLEWHGREVFKGEARHKA
jgi:putative restriction endonuclease